jgi:hypothetical protein
MKCNRHPVLFALWLMLAVFQTYAQSVREIDSLKRVIPEIKTVEQKLKAFDRLGDLLTYFNMYDGIDSVFSETLKLASIQNNKAVYANVLCSMTEAVAKAINQKLYS